MTVGRWQLGKKDKVCLAWSILNAVIHQPLRFHYTVLIEYVNMHHVLRAKVLAARAWASRELVSFD